MNATWQAPDFSECVSPAYKTLHQEVSHRTFNNLGVAVRKKYYNQGVGGGGSLFKAFRDCGDRAKKCEQEKQRGGGGESVETLSLPLPPLSLSSSPRSLNSRHSPLAESLDQAMVVVAGTMNVAGSKKQTTNL